MLLDWKFGIAFSIWQIVICQIGKSGSWTNIPKPAFLTAPVKAIPGVSLSISLQTVDNWIVKRFSELWNALAISLRSTKPSTKLPILPNLLAPFYVEITHVKKLLKILLI